MGPYERSVGRRIETARRSHGLPRRVLAELLGRSEEWLRQIESGRRPLDSIAVAARLTELLRLDLSGLIQSSRVSAPAPAHELTLVSLRRRLMAWDRVPVAFRPPPDGNRPRDLAAELQAAWREWEDSPDRYTRAATRLPLVLAHAQTAVQVAPPEQADSGFRHLVDALSLARSFLSALEEHPLSWLAATRATAAAERAGEPLLIAVVAHDLSVVSRDLGFVTEARELALAAAAQIEAEPRRLASTVLWGALHLAAAQAAAAGNDPAAAESLLATTERAADLVGPDRSAHQIRFGKAHLMATAVEVSLRLGRVDRALTLARRVALPATFPAGSCARHHVTVAYAHVRRRDELAALFSLIKAANVCPEELRHSRMAHDALGWLVRRDNATVRSELRRLTRTAGILD